MEERGRDEEEESDAIYKGLEAHDTKTGLIRLRLRMELGSDALVECVVGASNDND